MRFVASASAVIIREETNNLKLLVIPTEVEGPAVAFRCFRIGRHHPRRSVLYQGMSHVEKQCQGTTSVVPHSRKKRSGFSP